MNDAPTTRSISRVFHAPIFALAYACATPQEPVAPKQRSSAPPVAAMIREGSTVTYQGTARVGSEQSRDDGDTLSSTIEFNGKELDISMSRSKRSVACKSGLPVTLDERTVALENGHWQAYALAAERFRGASTPAPIKVLLPCAGVTVDATIVVRPLGEPAEGTRVEVTIKGLAVQVALDRHGQVLHAEVKAQGIVVRREADGPPPSSPSRARPSGVTEEATKVTREGVVLRGSLWLPMNASSRVPVALIIAGSGPTDRDGNNSSGLKTDAYRLMATTLAEHGIASLRFDKRGVGESGRNFAMERTTFSDFVDDALAWIHFLRNDPRFGPLTLIGHSEGAEIAVLAAQKTKCEALISVAGSGRPFDVLLREQLAREGNAETMVAYDRIVAALRKGEPVDPVPTSLASLFPPHVRAFVRSELDVDPSAELRKVRDARITILQGDTDIQVTVVDAKKLAQARPDATLKIISKMNHVLKEEERASIDQASYTDPSKPIAPAMVEALIAAVAK
jgi:uncharacterized protein